LTTTTTRPRLTLFGDRPSRSQDVLGIDTAPTAPAIHKATDDAVAAIRASFSEKRFRARRSVHHVT
jgi:hypothetical protein